VTRVAVEIPKVGLVMESARLIRWLKNVGEAVAQGEPLLELETEKSVVEIESTESGRLVEILLQADQEARVGDRIGWIETDTARIVSSPAARRLAATHTVDVRQIEGTGPRGRVQMNDVRRAVDARSAAAGGSPLLSGMRRALARSMTLSNATVPQFAIERSVDWTEVHRLRAATPGLSINDFLLQAMGAALLSFPALNATFSGDANSDDANIVSASGAHVGLVVAVGNGLLVPVLHGVEQFGLAELARRRRALVERALANTLKREELEGATISLSNLGARGPDRFNALINPPQSAILAVGRQRDCVVARNGGIHVRPVSQLTLTVDHRIADGRLASDFLAFLVDILGGDVWRMN
jgi:pyruvate dehydrogenase E2 component (dihydrolipoamide acetyltransferase)